MTVEELFGRDDAVLPVAAMPVAPLDRALADAGIEGSQLPGYDTRADGHLQVAAAIAAGLADAEIASEPAALAYDLAFVPLAAERFDLVISAGHVSTREVQGLLKVLSSAWLLDQLASLPGYDPGPVRGANHDAAAPTLTPVKISFMGALAG